MHLAARTARNCIRLEYVKKEEKERQKWVKLSAELKNDQETARKDTLIIIICICESVKSQGVLAGLLAAVVIRSSAFTSSLTMFLIKFHSLLPLTVIQYVYSLINIVPSVSLAQSLSLSLFSGLPTSSAQ